MARYASMDTMQHARQGQYVPDEEYFVLDSNLSSPSVSPSVSSSLTSNFSLLETSSRNAFRPSQTGYHRKIATSSFLPPLLCSSLPADEWSGTTNTMPDTPSSQLHASLETSPRQGAVSSAVLQPHPFETGGTMWKGHGNLNVQHFSDHSDQKRVKQERDADSTSQLASYEQMQQYRLPGSTSQVVQKQQQQAQNLSAAAALGVQGYSLREDNLRRIQAMQRPGGGTEANQKLMNALYASGQFPNLQGEVGGYQLSGDQKVQANLSYRQLASNQFPNLLDGNLLRHYGIQQGTVGVDQQQQSPLLQGHGHFSSHVQSQLQAHAQVTGQRAQFQQSANQALLQSQYQNGGNQLQAVQQMYSNFQPGLQGQVMHGSKLPGTEGTRHPVSLAVYSKCSQIMMLYVQEQSKKPTDNSIHFWRTLFQTFFAERATQRWCLTCYNASPVGRHAQALFPMDHWKCNLCGVQPGRGFEASVDVLPRLSKIKYDSGLFEELIFLEFPDERYMLPSGSVVLEYSRAVHESVFAEIRIIRYGRLRVTFNSSFKIYSWEFCTKSHEEVVPRKNLFQQAHQLSNLVQEADREGFDTSMDNLKSHCNAFTLAAKQLAVKLDAPSVNDLGFSKRYIRCLQIAEVVNSMDDLIGFAKKTGLGPIESLVKFPNARKRKAEDPSPQSSSITYLPPNPTYQSQGPPQSVSNMQKLSVPFNQLPPEVQASLLQQYGQMAARVQLPSPSDSVNQYPSQRSAQGTTLQSEGYGGATASLNQMRQQFYQQQQQAAAAAAAAAVPRHVVPQISVQQLRSHSNQTGQQSLPGTPQSEMSDLRSNAS